MSRKKKSTKKKQAKPSAKGTVKPSAKGTGTRKPFSCFFAGGAVILCLLAVITVCAVWNGAGAPVLGVEIVNAYPHDREAFTQGLLFDNGFLYESTGIKGKSSLRKVDLKTGKVQQKANLDYKYFGEGLTLWKNRFVQLTWKSNVGFVYEKTTFKKVGDFRYKTEGWGLTHDGKRLIMSDGSSTIRFLDPNTFQVLGAIEVKDGKRPVRLLNELEFVNGEIWANVLNSNRIARISPNSGRVGCWLDLSELARKARKLNRNCDVLNGIAFDEKADRIYVTGKFWPELYEIRIKQ